jgi:hypothetical protein
MGYVRVHRGLGVTRDQQAKLLEVSDEELQSLPPEVRLNLVLRRQEVKATELSARWNAIATGIAVAVPILAVFGITMKNRG